MASIVTNIASKMNLNQNHLLLAGRVNDIFVNLKFDKHERINDNMVKPDYNKSMEMSLFEALMQPKYDSITITAYVSKKDGPDIEQLSNYLDTHYENFRTSLPVYVNGHFSISLYRRDTINLKAWYVIDFLKMLTLFLNECGYSSGCAKCGSNDNLTHQHKSVNTTEICENCRLKEAVF